MSMAARCLPRTDEGLGSDRRDTRIPLLPGPQSPQPSTGRTQQHRRSVKFQIPALAFGESVDVHDFAGLHAHALDRGEVCHAGDVAGDESNPHREVGSVP